MDINLWLKAVHIMAVIAWMAGLFYLPRLYVYHTRAKAGSETSETFKVMEEKLLRIIMNPAMIVTWIAGGLLVYLQNQYMDGWFHVKLLLVVAMSAFHGALSKWRKDFAADANTRSERFYRLANEVPTLLMVLIVILVVVKPL